VQQPLNTGGANVGIMGTEAMRGLGARLRRFTAGLTLAESTRRSHNSKSHLYRIARDQSPPLIAVLTRLGSAYGAHLAQLPETGEAHASRSVVRAVDRLEANRDGNEHGYRDALVNRRKPDRRSECFVVRLPAVDDEAPPFRHEGEEMLDGVYFHKRIAHRALAEGGAPATALAVAVPPAATRAQEETGDRSGRRTGEQEEPKRCSR